MNRFFIMAIAVLASAEAFSCRHGVATSSATAAATDSAAVDTLPLPVVVEHFPDTAYESARIVKSRVVVPDTAISGRLASIADLYESAPGAFTFRKGATRRSDFGGRVSGRPDSVVVDWRFTTGVDNRETDFGTWGGGTGWTGQPLYVAWPDSCIARFKAAGYAPREIIVGSLDGNVYFIDYETGKASREAVPVGNPIKGTVSLDPTLNGNLYVGQGIPAERPFGALMIDLFSHRVSHFFPEDPAALRRWGAYDSSPVRVGQFLFRPGENGSVYKFLISPGDLKLHSVLRYTVNGAAPGIESSMGVYRNYGYVADNHGNIICINLDTMRPVWRYPLGDDTDATPVVEVENDRPVIYVGCEVDRQDSISGRARFVKLDGLDGSQLWKNEIVAYRANINEKHFDGGYYASPLPGSGNCSDLIFANCVLNTRGQNGRFMALDRATGEPVYSVPLKYYAWSSPVGFLNERGEMFVFTADCAGNVYIIDGRTGEITYTARVGNNFESSPVVVGSSVVVGSRGDTIFKMTLK